MHGFLTSLFWHQPEWSRISFHFQMSTPRETSRTKTRTNSQRNYVTFSHWQKYEQTLMKITFVYVGSMTVSHPTVSHRDNIPPGNIPPELVIALQFPPIKGRILPARIFHRDSISPDNIPPLIIYNDTIPPCSFQNDNIPPDTTYPLWSFGTRFWIGKDVIKQGPKF